MVTVLTLIGLMRLLPLGARKSHRVLGCLLMATGALLAFGAWLSGLRLELRS